MSAYTDYLTASWKARVPASWRLHSVGDTHVTFLHPRKGFRRMSRKRLGL